MNDRKTPEAIGPPVGPGGSQQVPFIPGSEPKLALVITGGEGRGRRIAIRRLVALIGSRRGCKVNLQHPSIAPAHIAVVHCGHKILVRDLASVRGSRLNGLPLELEELSNGDALSIGPWEFRVDIEPVDPALGHDRHVDLDPTPGEPVLEHGGTRRIFQPTREVCVIGRRSRCDIAIDDAEVSRVHALIFRYHERPAVVDLLASSPLRVNGTDAPFAWLAPDDVLELGQTQFRVRFPKATAAPRSNGSPPEPIPVKPPLADDEVEDLIDIRAAEASQRWVVAENLERIQRKQAGS